MNSILKRVTASGNEKAGDHLHLDFFGVGHGYTKGLETQVSLNKALEEIGFTTGYDSDGKFKYAIVKWQDRERQLLDQICKKYGLEIHHPEIEYKEHMKIQQFRAEMELKNILQEIQQAKELMSRLKKIIKELEKTASIAHLETKEVKEAVEEKMQDIDREITLTRKEYNTLLRSATAYESVLELAGDRGERLIELERDLSDCKHALERAEHLVEKLEEKNEDYENYLDSIHNAQGVTGLEAYEKKRKKEEKERKEQEKAAKLAAKKVEKEH